jgi:uncharacterized protein
MAILSLCQIGVFLRIFFDRAVQKYYHARLMSAQTVIDSLEFAGTGQTLRGSLAVPELTRLKDSLADLSGEVEFVLKGSCDARRRPVLMLEVSGLLHLQCERCLEPLDFPLRLSNTLLLVSTGDAAAGEFDDEDPEWVEASGAFDVRALIEDEIILSLPYALQHEEGRCGLGEDVVTRAAAGSVFAKLAALKPNSH